MSAMILKSGDRYIGRIGLHPPGATLGFFVAKEFWGRGFATEAAHAIVDHAVRALNVPRILASVEVGNAASVRVLEKLGFKHVRRENGEPRSFDHFELTAASAPSRDSSPRW